MKLLFILVAVSFLGFVGFQLTKLNKRFHKHLVSFLHTWRYPLILLVILGVFGLFYLAWFSSAFDSHCIMFHIPAVKPPSQLVTASDYLVQGDYDFDRGNCSQALADYSQAIVRDQQYAEAYNNRAYTYMRMRDYALALPDLNTAISLRPAYVNALVNRGDIFNYYYQIDKQKAIADYDRAIATGNMDVNNSVCGHRAVAIYSQPGHKGWNIMTYLPLFLLPRTYGCTMSAR